MRLCTPRPKAFYGRWKLIYKMNCLSYYRFCSSEVRLAMGFLAYNMSNLWRRLALPRPSQKHSLTILRQRLVLTIAAVLGLTNASFAQADQARRVASLRSFFIFFPVIGAVLYIFVALAIQTIAQKTHTENPLLAWIPIANMILLLNIAKKPVWWILLLLIPLVDIIILIIVMMGVAEARQKPSWWGILTLIPVVNLIAIGYLAWAD